MKIAKLFDQKKIVYSFEIYPPNLSSGVDVVYETLKNLTNLKPDYLSVTYGAGGTEVKNRTCEISALIKNTCAIEPLAHLTCVNSRKSEVSDVLNQLSNDNIHNILAMRGDIRPNTVVRDDFKYASQLMDYIAGRGGFHLAAACYPEGHPECESLKKDIEYMKLKQDCGAQFFITQLFFDNDAYYDFVDKARARGITAPIQAGIMPLTNIKQIERTLYLSGAKVPHKLSRLISRYGSNRVAMTQAGIMYATEQIISLLENDVQGIHLYTMNKLDVARKITENIDHLISMENTSYLV